MNMENIFKNAKFGDRFITRDGHMAVFSSYCSESETVHLMINYSTPQIVRYDYNGMICDSDSHNTDIIGTWDDWHDVNDEMPPCDEDTWDSYLVRTSLATKSEPKGVMFVAIYHDYNFMILGKEYYNNKITHWTKLPKQPNILSNENK